MIRQKESASVCLSDGLQAVCVCGHCTYIHVPVCVCEGRIGGPAGTTLVNNGSFIPTEQLTLCLYCHTQSVGKHRHSCIHSLNPRRCPMRSGLSYLRYTHVSCVCLLSLRVVSVTLVPSMQCGGIHSEVTLFGSDSVLYKILD